MRGREAASDTGGRSRGKYRRAFQAGCVVALAFLLLLTVLDLPTRPYDLDHDLSSSAALEYFAARGVQFGTELIQNVGPLGWVQYSAVYAGFLQDEKIVLGLLRAAALCGLVLWACTRFRGRAARTAWLLAFVALIPIYPIGEEHEVDFAVSEEWTYLCAYLSGLALLAFPRGRERYAVLPAFLLAFLALIKHTLLFVSLFIVGSVALERLRRRELRTGLVVTLLYASYVALLWVVAGQQLANLPTFALGVLRFTAGYNEAMALPADPLSMALGCAVLAGLGALILWRALGRSQSPAKSAIDAFFLFVVWKHGFVRGDPQHVAIFFHTSAFLALLFGLAVERESEQARPAAPLGAPSTWLAVTSAGMALLCAAALFASVSNAQYRPARLATLWSRNLEWLLSPARRSVELSRELLDRELEFRIAWMQRVVGPAPIDFFGMRPGWVLLSGLSYTPRPMPIPFAATNEFLLRRNEEFYRDRDRAPRFILCELATIDNRLVSLDDGLALGAILDNYHPVRIDAVWNTPGSDARSDQETPLLLERNPPGRMREQAQRALRETKEIGFGEELSFEQFGEEWLWLEAHVEPSPLGRLRGLLLRPAPLAMALETEPHEGDAVRRYVASMGTAGFLISPLIETNRDLFDAYATDGSMETLERVRSLRFETDPADLKFFEQRILVRIYGAGPPGRSSK